MWSTVGLLVLSAVLVQGQFLDRLRNPRVTVTIEHPPELGLKINRVAFGEATGECSDTLIDALTQTLVNSKIEVLDRQNLEAVLREQNFSLSGYVDRESAMQMGKILGPTALVFVKVQRCQTEQTPLMDNVKVSGRPATLYISRTKAYLRGSVRTIDLTTGRIFAARTIDYTPERKNESLEGRPEFPSEIEVRDLALRQAATEVARQYVPWSESKQLYFFNDDQCDMKLAHQLLKAGDVSGTLKQSEANLERCKSTPGIKPAQLAHAHYNLGLMQMITAQYQEAEINLSEAVKLRGGDIAAQALAECRRAEALAKEAQRVDERTVALEQSRVTQQQAARAAKPTPPRNSAPPEDRLKRLDELHKKGLISKDEFEQKKAEILKEL